MDPTVEIPGPDVEGFPRPRGDGPQTTDVALLLDAVSPPTRGWTRMQRDQMIHDQGFPAHAGMDLSGHAVELASCRFPRPRGDGPSGGNVLDGRTWVSPPTRGWTQHTTGRQEDHMGFPAHAGMDLHRDDTDLLDQGFPRPRGDGPNAITTPEAPIAVSPPTRGWTHADQQPVGPAGGFPAHAGMDPVSTESASTRRRFPRPRGDGPYEPTTCAGCTSVSPPTRGWTRDDADVRDVQRGFPAHAGMDPSTPSPIPMFVRFPRPRGDGP